MMHMIRQHISTAIQEPHPDYIATRFGMVRPGMDAWGHDGLIGRVVLLVLDRHTHEPSHLVVQRGWFWGRRLLIPLHWTIDIVDNRVNLNLRKSQLEHLAEYRSDIQIAREVQAAIYTSPDFMPGGDCATISVVVQHGVVILRGNVRDQARRFAAQSIANRIPGVQVPRNELVADDELRQLVALHFSQDPAISRLDLSITVNLGLVEIRGIVPAASLHERLITVVRHIPGVRAIWNNVVVDTAVDRYEQGLNVGSVSPGAGWIASRAETVSTVSP